MSMTSLSAIKAQNKALQATERRNAQRKRDLVILILRHLCEQGYLDTYERLCRETNLNLNKVIESQDLGFAAALVLGAV